MRILGKLLTSKNKKTYSSESGRTQTMSSFSRKGSKKTYLPNEKEMHLNPDFDRRFGF